jgi:hypothetical protein
MASENAQEPGLVVLWITRDREAALNMALMYAKNARLKGWWERVHLLVWGPSADILAYDQELQEAVAACREVGVEVFACRACADHYQITERLAGQGITVLYTGEPLTLYLRDGWKVLSV